MTDVHVSLPPALRRALELLADPPADPDVSKGYLDLPTGPGLGIELDEAALADKINHDWKNRDAFDEDDGSVVDW